MLRWLAITCSSGFAREDSTDTSASRLIFLRSEIVGFAPFLALTGFLGDGEAAKTPAPLTRSRGVLATDSHVWSSL
jgi:hypothetical protein